MTDNHNKRSREHDYLANSGAANGGFRPLPRQHRRSRSPTDRRPRPRDDLKDDRGLLPYRMESHHDHNRGSAAQPPRLTADLLQGSGRGAPEVDPIRSVHPPVFRSQRIVQGWDDGLQQPTVHSPSLPVGGSVLPLPDPQSSVILGSPEWVYRIISVALETEFAGRVTARAVQNLRELVRARALPGAVEGGRDSQDVENEEKNKLLCLEQVMRAVKAKFALDQATNTSHLLSTFYAYDGIVKEVRKNRKSCALVSQAAVSFVRDFVPWGTASKEQLAPFQRVTETWRTILSPEKMEEIRNMFSLAGK